MRIWILRLHLYGGLLCCSYLLLFGISSLLYNHHPEFAEPGGRTITWERDVTPGTWANDTAEAKAIHQELGLIGWAYDEHRQRNGDLLFTASRPGKVYHIVASKGGTHVIVAQTSVGVWQVVRGLHGLEELPNSPFMNIWGWYTELCTFVVLFAAVSGIYLWAMSRRRRTAVGWSVLGAAVVLSLFLMIYIRVWG
jgi:hypothetical protein